MFNFDYRIFQAFNDKAGHSPIWDAIMKFLSNDGAYIFFVGFILYWFIRSEKNRRMVVEMLVAACVALGIGTIISHCFYRDRPFVQHQVHQLIQHAANASFPSDHATAAFAAATAIWCSKRTFGWLWLALAAGISMSRVWTGVHYPLDVISGALLGVTSALAVHVLFSKSSLVQRSLIGGIRLYERLERKVWPAKST